VNKSTLTTISIVSIFVTLAGCVSPQVYQCDSSVQEATPVGRFEVNQTYGIAFDRKTKLTWKLCAEGQSHSNGHCTGNAAGYTWEEAMQAFEHKGDSWRLPNVDELKSIVEEQCQKPAINLLVFPNTPPTSFWSASLDDADPARAWYVSFFRGGSNSTDKAARHNIRLVRGEDPKIAEERQEHLLELMEQNRIEELLKQEKDAESAASVGCSNKARCDRIFSLTQTYISSEATAKIKVATDMRIETYEPAAVGDIAMSATRTAGKGGSAEVRLSVSCKIFGSDAIIENLNLETEAAESLKAKMKKSKISCLSKKISIYRDFRSFVDDQYGD
jgi:Protein of unknown function (DUF1566)